MASLWSTFIFKSIFIWCSWIACYHRGRSNYGTTLPLVHFGTFFNSYESVFLVLMICEVRTRVLRAVSQFWGKQALWKAFQIKCISLVCTFTCLISRINNAIIKTNCFTTYCIRGRGTLQVVLAFRPCYQTNNQTWRQRWNFDTLTHTILPFPTFHSEFLVSETCKQTFTLMQAERRRLRRSQELGK